jgi:hypothetical protein
MCIPGSIKAMEVEVRWKLQWWHHRMGQITLLLLSWTEAL